MSGMDDNCLTFSVFVSRDIKGFLVLPIDEVFLLIGKDLEPLRVSAPDLHVAGLSGALDVP